MIAGSIGRDLTRTSRSYAHAGGQYVGDERRSSGSGDRTPLAVALHFGRHDRCVMYRNVCDHQAQDAVTDSARATLFFKSLSARCSRALTVNAQYWWGQAVVPTKLTRDNTYVYDRDKGPSEGNSDSAFRSSSRSFWPCPCVGSRSRLRAK